MSGSGGWVEVALDRLVAHPKNSNVMRGEAYEKLKAHLAVSNRYPPLIVRALPSDGEATRYELLDGHHRAKALRELGRATARCDVWDVDDAEALVLLGTLNRLRGRDDPRRRAALLADVVERLGKQAAAARLPETKEKLKRFAELHRSSPSLREPRKLSAMPVATHFFLLPEQKRKLDAALKAAMTERGDTRESALMRLIGE